MAMKISLKKQKTFFLFCSTCSKTNKSHIEIYIFVFSFYNSKTSYITQQNHFFKQNKKKKATTFIYCKNKTRKKKLMNTW